VSYSGGGFGYIVPPAIRALGDEAVAKYEAQMAQMQSWYDEWREALGGAGEASNEDARFVLPGACETRMMLTMNARELLHFFSLRCCNRAQWEIRALAWEMLALAREAAPALQ
jgi:thymidylate synthase (FAD)